MQNFKRKHKVLFLHVNIVFAISYAVYMHLSEFGKAKMRIVYIFNKLNKHVILYNQDVVAPL